jgi:hypothetical protein
MRADLAAEAIDALFDHLADTAVLTLPGGVGTTVELLADAQDALMDLGPAEVNAPSLTVQLRVADVVGTPQGARLDWNGSSWVIHSAARRDPLRRLWSCQLRPRR